MKKSVLAVLIGLSFSAAYAQTASQEKVLNSDPIDVDGYLAEQRVTDGELESINSTVKKYQTDNKLYREKAKALNKLTNEAEKIGENAEEKIHATVEAKKAEKKAMEKIKKAEAKLKCLMEENPGAECDQYGMGNQDEVKVQQAAPQVQVAPVATSETAVASSSSNGMFETIKLLPFAGATTYRGDVESLETSFSGGLRTESQINNRFSLGIGFNYNQLNTEDFANNQLFNQPFSNQYFGAYGLRGRQIDYSSFGLDIYGKFFLTNGERFRPYIGAGVGYNRATLQYAGNNQQNVFAGSSFGNERYQTSFASGNLMLGSEIMVSKMFGLNIEAGYSTGLGSSLSSQNNQNFATSPDQRRLNQLGDEIINANALSVNLGLLIVF
ncbi:MAG: outer membrane beta-barrel protein [Bacteriovoracaceae bacterium]|jgi:outer membrane protein W